MRWQVGPQLKAMHAAKHVALRHFLVHDAGPGRHPLDISGTKIANVAKTVAMLDIAGEHIGDRFDAAMRMPGETLYVILRAVIAEIIHHQERISERGITKAEHALEIDTGTFNVGCGAEMCFTGRMTWVRPFNWFVGLKIG